MLSILHTMFNAWRFSYVAFLQFMASFIFNSILDHVKTFYQLIRLVNETLKNYFFVLMSDKCKLK